MISSSATAVQVVRDGISYGRPSICVCVTTLTDYLYDDALSQFMYNPFRGRGGALKMQGRRCSLMSAIHMQTGTHGNGKNTN